MRTISLDKSPWKGFALIGFVSTILLAACGDDGNSSSGDGVVKISDKTISGVSQKGPFVNGSSVTVQELDGETLAQTGASYEGKIKNDMGEFSVKVAKLASQYALLKANGFYRNEVTGGKSKSQVTLYALTDLSDRDEVNVNLLTHLEYERTMYLASDGMSVGEAKKQAENEVLASFGIEGDFANSEDLDIFGAGDGNAALLAVSVLMQGDLSEADFSERLANYAADIEEDGEWDDEKSAAEIADWAAEKSLKGGLSKIRNNIIGWGLSGDVPVFEKYVDDYWWKKYGLDACTSKREGEVKAAENAKSAKNGVYFICKNKSWVVASDVEYDTYEKKCDEDGKVVFGNVNKEQPYDCDEKKWRKATGVEGVLGGCIEKRFDEVAEALGLHYICESRQWRKATDIEKDTYKWKPGKDADVKNGDVIETNCYVFEDSAWRKGSANDCSLELRGCTKSRQDTIGLGKDKNWYICDSQKWRMATNIEKDTATWGAGEFDGEVRAGQVNKGFYYIYEADQKTWREASTIEKDTYDHKNNKDWTDGEDGEERKGTVTDSVYVFDSSKWRSKTPLENQIGICLSTMFGDTASVLINIPDKGDYPQHYMCKKGIWEEVGELEYKIGSCTMERNGDTASMGDFPKYYYMCQNEIWKNVTEVEYKNGLCTSEKSGYIVRLSKYGFNVYDNSYDYYECRNEMWKKVDADDYIEYIDETYGKCVKSKLNTIVPVGDFSSPMYYSCQGSSPNYKWMSIDLRWGTSCHSSQEDEIFNYQYGVLKCQNDSLVPVVNYWEVDGMACNETTENDAILNFNSMNFQCGKFNMKTPVYEFVDYRWKRVEEYGELIDERDGKKYKTINIGAQVWMAENLNYDYRIEEQSYGSMCFDNDVDNCEKYGRLYTWAAAMDSAALFSDGGVGCGYDSVCDVSDVQNVRGVCPQGWRLPSYDDFNYLLSLTYSLEYANKYYIGGYRSGVNAYYEPALLLKSTDGWVNDSNGIDFWGFNGRPVGWYDFSEKEFREKSYFTAYWLSGQYGRLYLERGDGTTAGTTEDPRSGLSVRCIKDEEE